MPNTPPIGESVIIRISISSIDFTITSQPTGHWVEPTPVADGPALKLGDRSAGVSQLQGLLAEYGYAINPTGFFGDQTRDVVAAFQRHFRPARVDGIADGSTLDTLERLLIGRRFLLADGSGAGARAP